MRASPLLWALLLAAWAHAHERGEAKLTIAVSPDAVGVVLELTAADAVQRLGAARHESATPFDADLRERVGLALDAWLRIRADGAACPVAGREVRPVSTDVLRVEATLSCPPGAERLEARWEPAGGGLQLAALTRWVARDGAVTLATLDASRPTAELVLRPPAPRTPWAIAALALLLAMIGVAARRRR